MTESNPHNCERETRPLRAKRIAVRLFVPLCVAIIAIDTAPNSHPLIHAAKLQLSPILTRVGLWQGQWTLFAPNPGINNAWLSAEVTTPDGELNTWNSTYWAETSGWERFLRFRYINYYNRVPTHDKLVADDFADYLALQLISPTARPLPTLELDEGNSSSDKSERWRMSLFRNQLNISLPEDGSLSTREETLWISSSEHLTTREYQP